MKKNDIKELNIKTLTQRIYSFVKYQSKIDKFEISDESITRFLNFYVTAKNIQENEKGTSLRQIHKNKLVSQNYDYNYEKLHDFYTKMNQRQRYKLVVGREILKSKSVRECEKAVGREFKNTSSVKMFNMHQLDTLFTLHNSNLNKVEKTTYNRLKNNNIQNIKYKNLRDLILYIKDQIKISDLEYKNIQHYILEQTMMLELIKTMSYCYARLKNTYTSEEMKQMFILIASIPIIDERHKYIEKYIKCTSREEKLELILQIMALKKTLNTCIQLTNKMIEESKSKDIKIKYNKNEFKDIYIDSYKGKYTIKCDFNADDFNSVMKLIKSFNDKYLEERENINIQKFKEMSYVKTDIAYMILKSELKKIYSRNKIKIDLIDRIDKNKLNYTEYIEI